MCGFLSARRVSAKAKETSFLFEALGCVGNLLRLLIDSFRVFVDSRRSSGVAMSGADEVDRRSVA